MLSAPRPASARPDRGTVLVMVPAAVLVMIVLGSIAIDFGLMHAQQRSLSYAADDAANDAASYAVDRDVLREHGCLVLRPDRARAAAQVGLTAAGHDDTSIRRIDIVRVDGVPSAVVELDRTVDLVLAPALPGAPKDALLHARSVASLLDPGVVIAAC